MWKRIRKRELETVYVGSWAATDIPGDFHLGKMQHCCPRELWASFAMWMTDKTRTRDLTVSFSGQMKEEPEKFCNVLRAAFPGKGKELSRKRADTE